MKLVHKAKIGDEKRLIKIIFSNILRKKYTYLYIYIYIYSDLLTSSEAIVPSAMTRKRPK